MIGTPRFQHGSLTRVKNKTTDDTWYFRFYQDIGGKRVYRKQRIGSVRELPNRRDAEKAVLALRAKINSEARSPETVSELITHYKKHELTEQGTKRSSTREVYTGFLNSYVEPKWGNYRLDQVKTVAVEEWLRSLKFAPATKGKIRAVMSAVFAHGKRHGMVTDNPIGGVRCSSQRLKEPDVLTPAEFKALVNELPVRERAMVLLAGTTGVRRSELIALKWHDVNFETLQIEVNKSCVRGKIGGTKTPASAKPVPLDLAVSETLKEWKRKTLFKGPTDFLFPSERKNGRIPVWPDMVFEKFIRPAVQRAGIKGKVIGWHTFRRSYTTDLCALGVDVKTTQGLLRHANVRTTLDLYAQSIPAQMREANARGVEMLLPNRIAKTLQHPSAPSGFEKVAVGC